ncbi:hypothetical protein IQ06DRAFT_38661 [Phaeosphaeriaceae sp. SRC1lsM3a]|nr:hypothetical protein IQ06DRAFT_38661 [Stagonospora sp. SRC1lsM3a]
MFSFPAWSLESLAIGVGLLASNSYDCLTFLFILGAHHITPRMILEEDFLESLNVLSSALHPRTNRASSSIPVGHFRIACASQHLHVSCEHHHPRTTHRQRIHSFFTPFLITT